MVREKTFRNSLAAMVVIMTGMFAQTPQSLANERMWGQVSHGQSNQEFPQAETPTAEISPQPSWVISEKEFPIVGLIGWTGGFQKIKRTKS